MAFPSAELDILIRVAAFEHVRQLAQLRDHLTARELKPGFVFQGQRIPLINPRRGIFKPQQMRFLLSIKTVFPRPSNKIWYDDQRNVHRQIFDGEDAVDYAFMGKDPDAADNRWLRDALEHQVQSYTSWGSRRVDTKLYFLRLFPNGMRRH